MASKKIWDPYAIGLQVAKQMGDELLVFCPYHSDSNASAEYNIEKGLFHCFGCSTNRNARQLAHDLGGDLIRVGISVIKDSEFEGESLDDWIHFTKMKSARESEYLANRKVSREQIETYGIMQSSEGIVIPLTDHVGHTCGVQVRRFKKQPKYMFYGTKPALWPWMNLRRRGPLIVTEGAFGVLRLEQAKLNAVATLGSASVANSISKIKPYGDMGNVYGLFDRDQAGLIAAGKFVLNGFPAIVLPEKWADAPDELKYSELNHLKHNLDEMSTRDVNEILDRCPEPNIAEQVLQKYWRSL